MFYDYELLIWDCPPTMYKYENQVSDFSAEPSSGFQNIKYFCDFLNLSRTFDRDFFEVFSQNILYNFHWN